MATRLGERLTAAGLRPIWPVEANEVFVVLPAQAHARLQASGANYYVWGTDLGHADPVREGVTVRLVTSFATRETEVDRFVSLAAES